MTKSFVQVFIESCVVGLLLIPFAYVAGFFARKIVQKPSLPEICKTWNVNNIMEVNLFLTGFIFHMVFEYSGLNKKYVDSYY